MTREEKVIQFILDKTKGVVKLSKKTASELLDELDDHKFARIHMHKFNPQNNTWTFYRVMEAEDDELYRGIAKYNSNPTSLTWKYELILSNGRMLGEIYTIDNQLFRDK